MFVSLFPNWIGQTQLGIVKIQGDNLSSAPPTPSSPVGEPSARIFSGDAPNRNKNATLFNGSSWNRTGDRDSVLGGGTNRNSVMIELLSGIIDRS